MKILIRLMPGVLATLAIMALGAFLSSNSRAQNSGPSSAPSPAVSGVAAQPTAYASEPSRDYSPRDTREHSHSRRDFTCSYCGARIDADGRALSRRDRDYEVADYRDRDPTAQVVYVVHVNAGDVNDGRSWPQSIFPMSTRWAMPIRTACR